MSPTACFLAVPAVVYYTVPEGYVSTAELRVNADKIYQAALQKLEERQRARSKAELLRRDDERRPLRVSDCTLLSAIKVRLRLRD
jgi:tRNA threonylcarbamoyladenosine modification (KEOPS) complex  Pcc1 subunit